MRSREWRRRRSDHGGDLRDLRRDGHYYKYYRYYRYYQGYYSENGKK